ncbi:MAG TPA: peptidoglycan-binding protein [Methanosarcinales archaeon]|nr:peptidoglycan-binding protein [Methanosarcinales archaeon]
MKYRTKHLIYVVVILSFILIPSGVFADYGDTTLKKGMTHTDVIALQQRLKELDFFTEKECTNYFGTKTEESVKKFQQSIGLVADGIAGQKTLASIDIKIKQKNLIPEGFTQLQLGDTNELIKAVQVKLQQLKLYTNEPTSIYDEATKEAVEKFQTANSLVATGIVDKETLVKLNTVTAALTTSRSSSRPELENDIVTYAKKFLGKPYVWGASNGKSFDCSGFVMYIFKNFDVSLGHGAASQFATGTKVSKENLQIGDAVFFTTYKKGASHVGIFIGENKFIHASSSGGSVIITDLGTAYYKSRYIGARRYL